MTRYTLRAIEPADRPVVTALLVREWGAAEVVALSIGGVLTRLIEELRGTGAARIRLTTTNDNTRALRFYQRAGFVFTALRAGAVAEARKLKPQIPEFGHDGIPVRDELELEFVFS